MEYWIDYSSVQPSKASQFQGRVDEIKESIKKSGFDKNHPLKIYKHPSGQRVCVNGHYRLKTESQVGMFGIKVFVEEVTFEEASKTTE